MTRTYLFARLWRDFPPEFDASEFDVVPDAQLRPLLDVIGATWIVSAGLDRDEPAGKWAHELVETFASLEIPLQTQETYDAIGTRCLAANANLGTFASPRWGVFHVVESAILAAQIRDVLRERFRPGFAVSYRLQRADEMSRTRAVGLERDLENYPTVHLDFSDRLADMFPKSTTPISAQWKRLQEEAQAASKILARLPVTERDGAALAVCADESNTGPDASGDLPTLFDRLEAASPQQWERCKPSQRSALQGFCEACRSVPTLDRWMPTKRHHDWLKKTKPELLVGRAADSVETWMTHARHGRCRMLGRERDRGHVATRSIVTSLQTAPPRRRDG